MWCIVNLPNGTQQAVKWDPKTIGQECLEKVCRALGIVCEMEYFGLEHWTPNQKDSRTHQWINLRNRLSYDGSSSIQLMLALRVKFWVPVHFIMQESVRNLFYMQAKSDLLEGRLVPSDWANAAKLAALLCQADGIRFNEDCLKSKCPIRMRRERELIKKHQQQHLLAQQKLEKKEKENVLSFKKRRLSKQKSIENIDNSHHTSNNIPNPMESTSESTTSVRTTVSSTVSQTPSRISTIPSTLSVHSTTPIPSRSTVNTIHQDSNPLEENISSSPLCIYLDYVIRAQCDVMSEIPDDFLRQVAVEHCKLDTAKMAPKSAKYWLLKELQEIPGYGEEVFSGVTNENSLSCDIAVGAHGITISTDTEKKKIPFSAIAAAKSFRRTFKLEYVDDQNDNKDLEIKLSKHVIAAGLYRSITERHAFYVCDKVRGVVTNQFTRDLKGTIASMFKEDTELGKRYVFDIQRTCREVHDHARRTLHEHGLTHASYRIAEDITSYLPNICPSVRTGLSYVEDSTESSNDIGLVWDEKDSMEGRLDCAIREKTAFEATIERCVEKRISEAMTCKICMDREINSMFNPCCHVLACTQCAERCENCPNCRVKVTSIVRIYLPSDLRTSVSSSKQSTEYSNRSPNTAAESKKCFKTSTSTFIAA